MAYPTTLNFKQADVQIAAAPLMTGYAGGISNGTFNVDTAQRHPLGFEIDVNDPTYGVAKFKYLKGVASTAQGDLVVFDPKAGTTTRCVAASRGPIAVAMSAALASQFGWYCVSGMVPVNTTAATINQALATTATPGQGTASSAASQKIDGLVCKSAQDGPGAGFTDCLLDYPSANGNT